MNVNTTVDIDAASREAAAEALVATTASFISAAKLDTVTLLDVMLEFEQRLRIARLRIAIEGDDVIAEVFETLAGVAAVAHEKLS